MPIYRIDAHYSYRRPGLTNILAYVEAVNADDAHFYALTLDQFEGVDPDDGVTKGEGSIELINPTPVTSELVQHRMNIRAEMQMREARIETLQQELANLKKELGHH